MKKGWRRPLELLIKIVEIMLEIQHVELEINATREVPQSVSKVRMSPTATSSILPSFSFHPHLHHLHDKPCGLARGLVVLSQFD